MTRILASLLVLGALSGTATASAASVASSGNFHVAAGAVGCHFVVYGPVSAGLGSAATIRCERYSDHTFMSMSASGKITESHSGTKVQPGTVGHSGKWFHRYTTNVGCETAVGYGGKPAVTCWHGSKSFVLGPGGRHHLPLSPAARRLGVAAVAAVPVSCTAPRMRCRGG